MARDPFLLFPAFLAGLPLPSSRAHIEDGRPVIEENGLAWVGVTGILTGDATSLAFQQRFAAAFGPQGTADPAALAQAADGLPGVRFADPTGEISAVLAVYRRRAVMLLAGSLVLMAPLVAWRYGPRGIPPVLGPPALAILLTPALLALAGLPFTFFTALGLVLALPIGVDYAVFFAEDGRLVPVTMLGVTLAMSTAVLSFGLLAISPVEGMRTFGAAMLVAVPLAWALSPLAARANKRVR